MRSVRAVIPQLAQLQCLAELGELHACLAGAATTARADGLPFNDRFAALADGWKTRLARVEPGWDARELVLSVRAAALQVSPVPC